MIEKREEKRARVTMPATIYLNGIPYEGMIGNVTEEGIFYNMTTLIESEGDFAPHGNIDVDLHIPHIGQVRLECEIRWYLKPSEERKSLLIGMQVIDPSGDYRDWVRRLLNTP